MINRVKLDDRGEYIIRAENSYGVKEEPVFINVVCESQNPAPAIFIDFVKPRK